MASQSRTVLMTQAEYAHHRRVSKPYITNPAKNGVLVMRNGKVDVQASDSLAHGGRDSPVNRANTPATARGYGYSAAEHRPRGRQ